MKIYFGKNKKEAKEISLKNLLMKRLNLPNVRIDNDRHNDNSASWIEIRRSVPNGVIDITILFKVEDDNSIEEIAIYHTGYILDEDNTKKIL